MRKEYPDFPSGMSVFGSFSPFIKTFRPDFAQHAAPVGGDVANRCGVAFPFAGQVFQDVGTVGGTFFLLAQVRPQVVKLPLPAVAVGRSEGDRLPRTLDDNPADGHLEADGFRRGAYLPFRAGEHSLH